VAIATNLHADEAACNKGVSVVSASKLVKLVNSIKQSEKSRTIDAFKKNSCASFAQYEQASLSRLTMVNTDRMTVPIE
jgi:hypothetical protein